MDSRLETEEFRCWPGLLGAAEDEEREFMVYAL